MAQCTNRLLPFARTLGSLSSAALCPQILLPSKVPMGCAHASAKEKKLNATPPHAPGAQEDLGIPATGSPIDAESSSAPRKTPSADGDKNVPQKKKAAAAANPSNDDPSGLVAFFKHTGTDNKRRKLELLRTLDYHAMEYNHDYIQWLFPTDEESMFNRNAPILTVDLQRIFSQDEQLRSELRRNFLQFIDFLGFELTGGDNGQPQKLQIAAHFEDRKSDCWSAGPVGPNHNWLRISRVLRCLGICGLQAEQKLFMDVLEATVKSEKIPVGSSIEKWREHAKLRPPPPN